MNGPNPNQFMQGGGGFRQDMQAGPSMQSPQGMTPGVMMGMQQQGLQPQDPSMMAAMGGGPGTTTYTGPYPWKQGICECTQSGDICLEGLFCLPCLYGSTVSKVQGTPCLQPTFLFAFSMLFCLCPLVAAKSRRDIRVKFNLVAEPFSDCLTYLLYPFCTVCQEAYELRARGFGSQFGPAGMFGGGFGGMMGGPMMSPPGQMQMTGMPQQGMNMNMNMGGNFQPGPAPF